MNQRELIENARELVYSNTDANSLYQFTKTLPVDDNVVINYIMDLSPYDDKGNLKQEAAKFRRKRLAHNTSIGAELSLEYIDDLRNVIVEKRKINLLPHLRLKIKEGCWHINLYTSTKRFVPLYSLKTNFNTSQRSSATKLAKKYSSELKVKYIEIITHH